MNKPWLIVLTCLLYTGWLHAQDSPTQRVPKDSAHLLLNTAYGYILRPGEEKTDLDSALLFIGKARTLNERQGQDPRITGLCCLLTSKALKERGDIDQSRKYVVQAIKILQQAGDRLDWAYAEVHAAGYYSYDDHYQDSIRISLYQLAIPVFDSLGRKEVEAQTLELEGDCLLNNEGAAQALPVLLHALQIDTAMGKTDLRNLYTLLGLSYSDLADQRTALDYTYKAVRQEEVHQPQEGSLATAYNRLGRIYMTLSDFDDAALNFQKGSSVAIRFKDTTGIRTIVRNLVNAYHSAHKDAIALDTLGWLKQHYPPASMGDTIMQDQLFFVIYRALGRVKELSTFGPEIQGIYRRTNPDSYERLAVLSGLMTYYSGTKQYDKVKTYGQELLQRCGRLGASDIAFSVWNVLFKADSARGDWRAASVDYQRYIFLRDSSNDVAHSRQIAGLKVEYDTETKDMNIKRLTESDRLNQAALHQASIARNAIIGGAILLFILLALAINRYRLKQRSNRQLNRLLGEKEWLLKEIHHRVKNNLQLAMSLLNTQSFYIDNAQAQAAIQQSRNRMYAMSLIHQRLYQLDNLEHIDMDQYIPELVNYIRDAVIGQKRIEFVLDVQPIRLDVAQALPLGLILNEAITNSMKHAFHGRDGGRVTVRMHRQGDSSRIQLMISDNGTGLARDFNIASQSSMGMRLIETLVNQIDGVLKVSNRDGLSLDIQFDMFPQSVTTQ
jgi:two-component system, sensor histidine kinase PdtaS